MKDRLVLERCVRMVLLSLFGRNNLALALYLRVEDDGIAYTRAAVRQYDAGENEGVKGNAKEDAVVVLNIFV